MGVCELKCTLAGNFLVFRSTPPSSQLGRRRSSAHSLRERRDLSAIGRHLLPPMDNNTPQRVSQQPCGAAIRRMFTVLRTEDPEQLNRLECILLVNWDEIVCMALPLDSHKMETLGVSGGHDGESFVSHPPPSSGDLGVQQASTVEFLSGTQEACNTWLKKMGLTPYRNDQSEVR